MSKKSMKQLVKEVDEVIKSELLLNDSSVKKLPGDESGKKTTDCVVSVVLRPNDKATPFVLYAYAAKLLQLGAKIELVDQVRLQAKKIEDWQQTHESVIISSLIII